MSVSCAVLQGFPKQFHQSVCPTNVGQVSQDIFYFLVAFSNFVTFSRTFW